MNKPSSWSSASSPLNAHAHPAVRPQTVQDWEDHKHAIRQLYWDEDRDLTSVIQLMKDLHGFSATPKQYKTTLKRWGFEKNVKSSDMQHILRISKRRREKGDKATMFWVRDRPVPQGKIERWMGRMERMERLEHLGHGPGARTRIEPTGATTPPDIRYRSPEPGDNWAAGAARSAGGRSASITQASSAAMAIPSTTSPVASNPTYYGQNTTTMEYATAEAGYETFNSSSYANDYRNYGNDEEGSVAPAGGGGGTRARSGTDTTELSYGASYAAKQEQHFRPWD